MNLEFLRKEVDSYTAGASSLNRQMAFAGIAVIWVIVNQSSSEAIQNGALWLFVASLSADLMQYIVGAISAKLLDIKKQCELKKQFGDDSQKIEDHDFGEVSSLWHTPTWLCFYIKIILVVLGYYNLLKQLPIPDTLF
jgi:hypothetical protein